MEQTILNYGAVAVIFVFAIKEFFAYLKAKKENGVGGKLDLIRGNDLTHILGEMKVQTEQHQKQIELLTEIATVLRERK